MFPFLPAPTGTTVKSKLWERMCQSRLLWIHHSAWHPSSFSSSSSSPPSQIRTSYSSKITEWMIAVLKCTLALLLILISFSVFFPLILEAKGGAVVLSNGRDISCEKWAACKLSCTLTWPLLSEIRGIELVTRCELWLSWILGFKCGCVCVRQWQKLIKTNHTGFWCVWIYFISGAIQVNELLHHEGALYMNISFSVLSHLCVEETGNAAWSEVVEKVSLCISFPHSSLDFWQFFCTSAACITKALWRTFRHCTKMTSTSTIHWFVQLNYDK